LADLSAEFNFPKKFPTDTNSDSDVEISSPMPAKLMVAESLPVHYQGGCNNYFNIS
jgi:hypothetical protein